MTAQQIPAPAPAPSALGGPAPTPSAPAEGAAAPSGTGAPPPSAGAPPPDAAPTADAHPKTQAPADVELKLPEGLQAGEAFEAFKAKAKELGLDGPKAQALLELHAQQQGQVRAAQEAAFNAQQEKWAADLAADKDIGGAKLAESAALAQKALARFAPQLGQELDAMGLGNHPGLVRLLAQVGRAMADDSIAGTSASAGKQHSEEAFLRAMYPNSPTMFSKE